MVVKHNLFNRSGLFLQIDGWMLKGKKIELTEILYSATLDATA